MYCTKCGNEIDDRAKFCDKCGQQLSNGVVVGKKSKQAKTKSKNPTTVLIALVLVVTIIIVSVFDLWPWSTNAKNESGTVATNDQTPEDAVSFESFSLDEIVAQCPDCQAALETYIELITIAQDWTTSTDDIEALETQKCTQMQHFCTAQSIYVEDIPYAYRGSYGLYTGYWLGAGPSGSGSYIGTVYDINSVTYTGDWGYGVPNGEGQLYLENYMVLWDMTYTGELKNGMRDGTGSWIEFMEATDYNTGYFRVYEEAEYSKDQLTEWVNCAEYSTETGEIIQYCKMKTNEDGLPVMGETWGPDELSPEMQNVLGVVGALCAVGLVVYMTGEMIQSLTDSNYADSVYAGKTAEEQLSELNQYRTKKAAEDAEQAAQAKKQSESYKDYAYSKMKECEASGDTWSLDYQYFKSAAY